MTQPAATARHVAKLKAGGAVRITLMLPPDCVGILASRPAGVSRTTIIVSAIRSQYGKLAASDKPIITREN